MIRPISQLNLKTSIDGCFSLARREIEERRCVRRHEEDACLLADYAMQHTHASILFTVLALARMSVSVADWKRD